MWATEGGAAVTARVWSTVARCFEDRDRRLRTHRGVTAWCSTLLLGTLALAGCTVSPPTPTPTPSATATVGDSDEIQPDADVPTDVPNTPALRANVAISDCERDGEGWKASGTALNPDDKAIEYTITVFFTTDKATVIGTGDTKVSVPPGESADWEIRADLTPAPETLCVLRGVG
jgi:hypothetical protein